MDSLWKQTASMPSFPALEGDAETDVLIIGGGMAGLLCAHRLQEAGVEYLLLEAGCICGGVTGCTTAKITLQQGPLYHKLLAKQGEAAALLYVEALQSELDRYEALCTKIDCDYTRYLAVGRPEFHGEYMRQYSWAEPTLARLLDVEKKRG